MVLRATVTDLDDLIEAGRSSLTLNRAVRSDAPDVVAAIKLARATCRKMIQNLVWATAYNLVAIPVAGGLLVRWGLDLPERWCRRNEPLHHHRGCQCTAASPAETAERGPIDKDCNAILYHNTM